MPLELVEEHEYLRAILSSSLNFSSNTKEIQRQGPPKESQFVWSPLDILLLHLLLFPSISIQNWNDLQSAVNVCFHHLTTSRTSDGVNKLLSWTLVRQIIKEPSHCLCTVFDWLPSEHTMLSSMQDTVYVSAVLWIFHNPFSTPWYSTHWICLPVLHLHICLLPICPVCVYCNVSMMPALNCQRANN